MKAVVYEGPERLAIREVPVPAPQEGEVRLRVRACGICGSDVHGYLGKTGRRLPPMIMGHEFCGEVEECSKSSPLKKGDRVAVYPVDFCGTCEMCRRGDVHLCLNKRAFGVMDIDGAFSEYISVPEKCCFLVKDEISDSMASLMEPLAVAWRGVGHAGNLSGKCVLLVGTGTIGLLALACMRMKGAKKILVSDLSDSRLQTARQMGADITINPGREDLRKRILEETDGRGADVAIEAVGIGPTVKQAMDSLRFGGTAIWIGNNRPLIELNMQEVVTRELNIHGSFLYGYKEFEEAARLLNAGKFHVRPLISKEISMEEVPEYFEKLAKAPGELIKVVMVNKKAGGKYGVR